PSIHLVVQPVEPITRRFLRFGMERRLEFLNLGWRCKAHANLPALAPLITLVLNSGPFPRPTLTVSSVLRACPPPHSARPLPRGVPVRGHAPPPSRVSRVASASLVSTCRCHYPGGIVGSNRSWDGLFHPFPCSPTTTAFPGPLSGRLPHQCLSRLARHSLALRPIDSLHRQAAHWSRRLRRRCYLRRRSH